MMDPNSSIKLDVQNAECVGFCQNTARSDFRILWIGENAGPINYVYLF